MKNNCVFCAIAAGEIPSFKVYEDDIVLAYLDINPFSKGHVLVIPKEHTEGLLDTPDATLAAVIARVKKVAAHIKEALPCDGFNILPSRSRTTRATWRPLRRSRSGFASNGELPQIGGVHRRAVDRDEGLPFVDAAERR